MYLFVGDLIRDLKPLLSIQTFQISPSLIISGVQMFPASYDPAKQALRKDILYICEYRQLKRLEYLEDLPPLICVVESSADADIALLKGRDAIAVYGSTVVEVLTCLTNAIYETASKSSHTTELTNRLMKCASVTELLTVGFELLQNPLILTDQTQKIMEGTSEDLVSSPQYRYILNSEYLPTGHPEHRIANPDGTQGVSQFYDPGDPDTELPAVICNPLTVGNQALGYLHVLEFNREFDEEDRQVIQLLANLLALEIYQHPEARRRSQEQQAIQLFRDILDNVAGSAEQIMSRQRDINLRLGQFLYVMSVFPKTMDFSAHINFHELSQSIAWMFPGCYSFLFKEGIFVLLNCKEEILDMEEYLEPLTPLLEQHKLMVGISNPFSVIHQLRGYGFQARKAIHLGSVIHKEKSVYKFSDYVITYIAEMSLKNNAVETLCPPELIRLVMHDQDSGNNLLETLKVYLKCGRSKTATAKEMFLHVNTVKYRLGQIQNIMKIDLTDETVALRLMLAFEMLEYRDHFETYTPMEY